MIMDAKMQLVLVLLITTNEFLLLPTIKCIPQCENLLKWNPSVEIFKEFIDLMNSNSCRKRAQQEIIFY